VLGLALFAMGCREFCHQMYILPSLLVIPTNTTKAEKKKKRKGRRKSHTEPSIDESTHPVSELGSGGTLWQEERIRASDLCLHTSPAMEDGISTCWRSLLGWKSKQV